MVVVMFNRFRRCERIFEKYALSCQAIALSGPDGLGVETSRPVR